MILKLSSALRRFKILVLISPIYFLTLLLPQSVILAQGLIERPHVGLVLSGGGAFGMAHVGVIKVMEEAGLRPDYITGVSMGSIIGGMYSIGYKADSLEKLLKLINWDLILSNKIPENKIIFPEKHHLNNSVISLPVTLKKVRLPSGLINGQQIENMLSFYAWPAADINDFSKLPIPFMCLATNLVTCNKVELKSGYLPDAIRASMAVPSFFTPLKIDTLLLIDGGMIRNFPVSEVRDMGADIIIGSYTGRHLYKEDELQSVPEIIMQLGFFTGLNDFKEQRKLVNLFIEPDLSGLTRTKFEDTDSIIQRGYMAALPYREYFRKLADSLNQISPQKTLKNIMDKEYYSFDKIEITGNNIYSDDQILGVLDIKPGENVDKYLLNEKIELLYGKVWFEKVKYRFINRNDSLILAIDCVEKSRAMLYGSVHYDESLKSGVIIGMSIKNLLTRRSVIDFNSFIGRFYKFRFDYLQFIDRNQKYRLSANIYSDNTLLPMMELRGETGGIISRNYYHGLTLDRRLSLNHLMAISASLNMMNLIPGFISDDHLKRLSYNYLTAAYEYKVNTLDIKHFPNKGMVLNLYAGTSKLLSGSIRTDSSKTTFKESNGNNFSTDRFYTIYGNFRHYFSSGEKVTYSISGEALYISDSDSISAQNNFFLLGGLSSDNKRSIPMIGFHPNEIAVRKLAGIGAEIDIEIIENLHFNLMANIFAAQEADDKGLSLLSGYGIGAGYMSVIGPLRIGLMHGRYNNEEYLEQIKGYISFGYNF